MIVVIRTIIQLSEDNYELQYSAPYTTREQQHQPAPPCGRQGYARNPVPQSLQDAEL